MHDGEVAIPAEVDATLGDLGLSEQRKHEVAKIAYDRLFLVLSPAEALERSIQRKLES